MPGTEGRFGLRSGRRVSHATKPIYSNAMAEAVRLPDTNANPPVVVERALPGIALELPFEISFTCYGCQFNAIAQDSPDGVAVSVEGVVGAIPFSAESPAGRAMTIAMLARRPSSDIVCLELAGRDRIVLRGQAPLGGHPSRAVAVAAVSAVLSAAKPLIDILADCGVFTMAPPIHFDDTEAAVAVS